MLMHLSGPWVQGGLPQEEGGPRGPEPTRFGECYTFCLTTGMSNACVTCCICHLIVMLVSSV